MAFSGWRMNDADVFHMPPKTKIGLYVKCGVDAVCFAASMSLCMCDGVLCSIHISLHQYTFFFFSFLFYSSIAHNQRFLLFVCAITHSDRIECWCYILFMSILLH